MAVMSNRSVLAIWIAGLLLLPAWSAGAGPLTGHSSSDVVFDDVFIGTISEGRIGDNGDAGDYELAAGQVFGSPIVSRDFSWVSGQSYDWQLIYEPGSFGGPMTFILDGRILQMATATPFNGFLIRAVADQPGTRVIIGALAIAPPPSVGGVGELIYESSDPTSTAAADAAGSGASLDILRISNLDISQGFRLTGQATLFFENAYPPPQGDELGFQIVSAVLQEEFSDADGDGVPDAEDNCIDVFNPDRADDDGDGVGDACDNCVDEPNAPGPDGIQADADADGAGDACDNCPIDCVPIVPPSGSCANAPGPDGMQADTDSDGVGDRCDNCKFVKNGYDERDIPGVGNQLDSDGDGQGDACIQTTVILDFLGAPDASGGGGAGDGGSAATVIPLAAVDFTLDCGSQNVAAANIGVLLPDKLLATDPTPTLVDFAGCVTLVPNPDQGWENQMSCADPSTPSLGETISAEGSYTIGTDIQDPDETDGIPGPPGQLIIIHLEGAGGGLICESGDIPTMLGTLHLADIPQFSPIVISTAGFNAYEPVLRLLVDAASEPLQDPQILTQVNPPAGTTEATLGVRPALTGSDKRYEITIESGFEIERMAFGLTATSAVTGADISFGGCQDSSVADAPPGFSVVRGCTDGAPDLGPLIDGETFFDIPPNPPLIATYTIGPEGTPGLAANTLYIAVERKGDSINVPGAETVIGVVAFAEPAEPPQITFAGVDVLPGFEGAAGAIQKAGDPISPDAVALTNTFDSDEDTDSDGRGDDLDNCVNTPNGPLLGANDQENNGGVGFVKAPGVTDDEIGDSCQCGDFTGDGVVDSALVTSEDDVESCQEILALPPGQVPTDPAAAARCSVEGTTALGIIDIVVAELETSGQNSGVGGQTGGLQVCSPAVELQGL
jgi:hypothetical protein